MEQPDIQHSEIRAALRNYFADGEALAEVRAIAEGGADSFDAVRWQSLASDLGVAGIGVSDGLGGMGLTADYACTVLEEAGTALTPAPVRSTLTAAHVLQVSRSAAPEREEWLRQIATEGLVATVSVNPEGPSSDGQGRVNRDGERLTITADLRAVPDGMAANVVVVWAGADGGSQLVAVDLPAQGSSITRTPLAATDFSQAFADVALRSVPCVALTEVGAEADWEWIQNITLLHLAAESAGVAAGCLSRAAAYAAERTQFGRIISTYQAISHRLAETVVDVEAARGLVGLCGKAAAAGNSEDLARLAPLARAVASRAALAASDTLIQVHGGIGFTWEHDAHLYFRRARSSAAWFGSVRDMEDAATARGCQDLLTA
ncbi:acyl-CoA dehydrogenase [Rhodococcus sp. WS3]|uniref:acyl-CoA dehydrogenase family protein n=1 Tax=Rhodococcus sp. WS3 TaxID=2486271 RepID=UPI001143C8F1|nr:acyl-CoA dehydrogenase family protein [Rhodococcus sp. WS3]ROZ45655.1 acyl-CoA dehydrogenase [Rhodococcus sp. WS3]